MNPFLTYLRTVNPWRAIPVICLVGASLTFIGVVITVTEAWIQVLKMGGGILAASVLILGCFLVHDWWARCADEWDKRHRK